MKKPIVVCLHCGNEGITKDLVHCANCDEYAIHLYCMDVKPKPGTKPKSIHWICCENGDRFIAAAAANQKPEMIKRNKFLYSFIESPKFNSPSIHEDHTLVEPLIRSIWTGNFDVWFEKTVCQRMGSFSAFLSSRACDRVWNEAIRFAPDLQFEMLKKSVVWPKSFEESEPTEDNIGVYFFPSLLQNERLCDGLLFEMVGSDLAMRALLKNAELLVFTSMDLPLRSRRFQGAFYLWGVLRDKKC